MAIKKKKKKKAQLWMSYIQRWFPRYKVSFMFLYDYYLENKSPSGNNIRIITGCRHLI